MNEHLIENDSSKYTLIHPRYASTKILWHGRRVGWEMRFMTFPGKEMEFKRYKIRALAPAKLTCPPRLRFLSSYLSNSRCLISLLMQMNRSEWFVQIVFVVLYFSTTRPHFDCANFLLTDGEIIQEAAFEL